MTVLNDMDRFHLALDAIARLPMLGARAADLTQMLRDKLQSHHTYIREHGEDMPEVSDWKWRARYDE
jgi:xylulose-5-phosphate/fructose-6-phosphate phosphoketolase